MTQQSFAGFPPPTKNFFSLPNEITDIIASITNLSELKVLLYVMRHTWGYHEFGICKTISIDEFMHGRRYKDGSRQDKGTGLSRQGVLDGIERAIKDGYLICEVDASDLGRTKKSYALRMLGGVNDLDGVRKVDGVNDLDPSNASQQNRRGGSTNQTPAVNNLDPSSLNSRPRSEKETLERNSRKKPEERKSGNPPTSSPPEGLSLTHSSSDNLPFSSQDAQGGAINPPPSVKGGSQSSTEQTLSSQLLRSASRTDSFHHRSIQDEGVISSDSGGGDITNGCAKTSMNVLPPVSESAPQASSMVANDTPNLANAQPFTQGQSELQNGWVTAPQANSLAGSLSPDPDGDTHPMHTSMQQSSENVASSQQADDVNSTIAYSHSSPYDTSQNETPHNVAPPAPEHGEMPNVQDVIEAMKNEQDSVEGYTKGSNGVDVRSAAIDDSTSVLKQQAMVVLPTLAEARAKVDAIAPNLNNTPPVGIAKDKGRVTRTPKKTAEKRDLLAESPTEVQAVVKEWCNIFKKPVSINATLIIHATTLAEYQPDEGEIKACYKWLWTTDRDWYAKHGGIHLGTIASKFTGFRSLGEIPDDTKPKRNIDRSEFGQQSLEKEFYPNKQEPTNQQKEKQYAF